MVVYGKGRRRLLLVGRWGRGRQGVPFFLIRILSGRTKCPGKAAAVLTASPVLWLPGLLVGLGSPPCLHGMVTRALRIPPTGLCFPTRTWDLHIRRSHHLGRVRWEWCGGTSTWGTELKVGTLSLPALASPPGQTRSPVFPPPPGRLATHTQSPGDSNFLPFSQYLS